MRLILTFIFITLSYSQEWFITNYEYGKMLYNNPRGISCAKCHGEDAKGKTITKYKIIKNNKVIIKTIHTPNIQNITYERLKSKLLLLTKKDKKLSIMPRYNYLTLNEIEALYLYIQSKKDEK